jgi:acetyltransferase-like isoleucine patch superfamily enzyme
MHKLLFFLSKICHLIVKGADYYLAHKNHEAEIDKTTKLIGAVIIQNPSNNKSNISIGQNCIISEAELLLFGHGGKISIGNNCFIGKGSRIWSSKKITIGNNVLISHNVNIHDNISHPLNSFEREQDFMHMFNTGKLRTTNEFDLREAEVIIGDNAWLGFNSTISKGVTVGRGAIIGAHSLVLDDVPNFAVVVGNPAKIIKYTN